MPPLGLPKGGLQLSGIEDGGEVGQRSREGGDRDPVPLGDVVGPQCRGGVEVDAPRAQATGIRRYGNLRPARHDSLPDIEQRGRGQVAECGTSPTRQYRCEPPALPGEPGAADCEDTRIHAPEATGPYSMPYRLFGQTGIEERSARDHTVLTGGERKDRGERGVSADFWGYGPS